MRGKGYTSRRRIRGDGSCFYRSVGFGLLEQLMTSADPMRAEGVNEFLGHLGGLCFKCDAERTAHASLLALVRGQFDAV